MSDSKHSTFLEGGLGHVAYTELLTSFFTVDTSLLAQRPALLNQLCDIQMHMSDQMWHLSGIFVVEQGHENRTVVACNKLKLNLHADKYCRRSHHLK